MRVTIVTTWFPTTVSPGTGVFVARHAVSMARAGHDVRIVHLADRSIDDSVRRTRESGLPVIRIPMSLGRPSSVVAARRALSPLLAGSDLVHTHAVSALLPFALARPRKPWLHTEHWSGVADAGGSLSGLQRWAARAALQLEHRPDIVTVVSDQLATDLRSYRGTGPILTIPNEVAGPSTPSPRRRPRLGHDVLKLLGIGGLVPRKGPDTAVRITAELVGRGIPAELSWAGDGPLRETCARLADELAAPLALLGHVPPKRINQVLAEHDLLLVPTYGETFFLAAAEAIAAGRPVATGSVGGHTSFLDPDVSALVGGRDPVRWADAVVDLVERTAPLSAEQIRSTLPSAFAPEAVARQYTRAYKAAITAYQSVSTH